MRILHVLYSLDQHEGGIARAVLDLSSEALQFGIESEILSFGEIRVPDNPFPSARIHMLQVIGPWYYRFSPDLHLWSAKNLRGFDGVVLHGVWLYPSWGVARECTAAGVPYACFPHGMMDPWAVCGQGPWKELKKRLYWWLRERHVVNNARAVLFTTARELRGSQSVFKLLPRRLVVIPYGAGSFASQDAVSCAESTAVCPGPFTLFLGRVHPKKNVELLVEAWHRANVPPEWRLIIAGPTDPRYAQRLRRKIASYGLNDQVSFIGFVSGKTKRSLLERAEWFVLPSRQENFGVAVLEAIATHCPVVISDQVSIGEYLHPQTEILPLDLSAWTEFFRYRMTDRSWRNQMVKWDDTVRMALDIKNIGRQWASTLTDLFELPKSLPEPD